MKKPFNKQEFAKQCKEQMQAVAQTLRDKASQMHDNKEKIGKTLFEKLSKSYAENVSEPLEPYYKVIEGLNEWVKADRIFRDKVRNNPTIKAQFAQLLGNFVGDISHRMGEVSNMYDTASKIPETQEAFEHYGAGLEAFMEAAELFKEVERKRRAKLYPEEAQRDSAPTTTSEEGPDVQAEVEQILAERERRPGSGKFTRPVVEEDLAARELFRTGAEAILMEKSSDLRRLFTGADHKAVFTAKIYQVGEQGTLKWDKDDVPDKVQAFALDAAKVLIQELRALGSRFHETEITVRASSVKVLAFHELEDNG